MATIAAYLSGLWSGTEDAFWPHFVLLSGSVLAGVAVGAGILLEAPKYSEALHRVATWLVVVGVAVESICTISLFVIDERISNEQQSKIIELETRLASRQLSAKQIAAISQALTPFAGQKFWGMVASSVPDAWGLWVSIDKALEAANWNRLPPTGLAVGDPPAGIPVAPNIGVTILVPTGDVPTLAPAANALDAALNAAGIKTVEARQTGEQAKPSIIVIEIGTKP